MLAVVGSFCAQIIGYFFGTGNQWRYVILFGVVFSLINGVSMLFVLESPKFLASKGRFPEARYVLSRLRGTDDVEAELMSWDPVRYASSNSNIAEGSGVFVNSELSDIDTSMKNKKTDLLTVLKMKKYRQPLVLVFLLQTAQQLSGINAVTFYSNAIFSKMFNSKTSSILTLIVGATNVIFTFISIFVIDRVKRRKFLFFSMITMLISLVLLTISLLVKIDYLSVVSIYLVQITFVFGLAPLPFLIATEIFDQQGMSAGNSVSIASNWLWVFVIGIAFLPLQEVVGSYIFIIFIASLAVTFIFFYFFLPESKDKTYEYIEKEFKF
ncbi:Solute carrier family 2, facilitated glucose transporter member 3 [Smittium culicis]|uniref:Solute carrier family 2, facilitated glucose transporter member 3 n=1 Tax=Smittium culicis TaxID=133412 RepID=A0A1R1XND7_9FUNG|nr:Solute carrier family 2, facilitated glucose transporter member 3 [Smittium culicis]